MAHENETLDRTMKAGFKAYSPFSYKSETGMRRSVNQLTSKLGRQARYSLLFTDMTKITRRRVDLRPRSKRL